MITRFRQFWDLHQASRRGGRPLMRLAFMASARGQILPLVVVGLVVCCTFAALSIDVGAWRYQQQHAQVAADAGALAGALALQNSGTPAQMYAAANIDATANGYAGSAINGAQNAANHVTLSLNNPPHSGTETANSSAVEVIVSAVVPSYFGLISQTIKARAVASIPATSNCLLALDPDLNNQGTITLDGGSVLTPTCGIASNGQMLLNGHGSMTSKSITYRNTFTQGSTIFNEASPVRVTAAVPDPCSTIAGCTYLTTSPPTTGACMSQTTFSGPTTIYPGVYCSQVIFQGSGTITLYPGTYTFKQGFNVNGSTNLAGSNVTIYNAGTINFGQGTETLSAPTTGNTANVLIYQPVSDTNSVTFNGLASAELTGLVYAPGGEVILDGTSATLTEVVAYTLLLNATVSLDFSGLSSAGGTSTSLSE